MQIDRQQNSALDIFHDFELRFVNLSRFQSQESEEN